VKNVASERGAYKRGSLRGKIREEIEISNIKVAEEKRKKKRGSIPSLSGRR